MNSKAKQVSLWERIKKQKLLLLRLFVNCSGLKSAKLEKGQILSFLF
ncbi:ABC transporter membrane protein [Streptococcus pneumoniae]|nr:ABC transporter membrane protein [Streptococcus pneumoniae]